MIDYCLQSIIYIHEMVHDSFFQTINCRVEAEIRKGDLPIGCVDQKEKDEELGWFIT